VYNARLIMGLVVSSLSELSCKAINIILDLSDDEDPLTDLIDIDIQTDHYLGQYIR
jgi:hypothetical protein